MLLAAELIIDDVVPFARLREDLVRRFDLLRDRPEDPTPPKKHGIWPV
jgi:acetyl-CoA carboxylase carboxyltransferase component